MNADFEKLMEFAESDTMKDYLVDIRSHIDEIIFQTTINLGYTDEEIDKILAENIKEKTPDEIYADTFKHKFGYLFWRLFHYRNWKPDDDKQTEDNTEDDKEISCEEETPEETSKPKKSVRDATLKSVVVTGKLKNFSRKEIESFIKEHNFNLDPYVKKTTDYLICNDLNSTRGKLKSAKHYGTTIISEDEFLKMAEQNV
jgi:NAD-dependent DNA ligase